MKNQLVGEDAPPVAILRRIGKTISGNEPSMFMGLFVGLAILVSFLFVVSLVPQLNSKYGNLYTKKQQQKSYAAGLNACATKGDVDLNGKLDTNDSTATLKIAAGANNTDGVPYTDDQKKRADVDGKDGVTNTDAIIIMQKLTGQIKNFPGC